MHIAHTLTDEQADRLTGQDRTDVSKDTETEKWLAEGNKTYKEKFTDEHTERLVVALISDEQIYR